MTLKRKRSVSTLSPFSSPSERGSSSSPQPPQTLPASPNTDISMEEIHCSLHQLDDWVLPVVVVDSTPSHLNSRTRKRFRDGRPEESVIHESTYNRLFSAQRSPTPIPAHPRTSSLPSFSSSTTSTTSQQPHPKRSSSSQSSLHNFWAIPGPVSGHRQSSSSPSSIAHQRLHLSCEDCDASILVSTEDDCAMDIDTNGMGMGMGMNLGPCEERGEWACRDCGRVVCDGCAVVHVGEGRECLQCKTSRKRWVGGIGWMQPAYV